MAILLAQRSHPLYDENSDKWELYLNAAMGGTNFINTDNLLTHRLEDSSDYQARLDRAYYLNYCDAIPDMFNSYIFREEVERPPDANLVLFRANTNGRGAGTAEFVKNVGYFASIFGAMHVVVDLPNLPKKKVSVKYVKDNNVTPYCSLVYPSQLKDWAVDSQGNLKWVVIESTYYQDDDPTKEREEQIHYKLITRSEWRIDDIDGNPVKFVDGTANKGKNPLGIVPLVTMYHKDINNDRVGESLLKDIVYVNRAILNWCSCVDEQIERQTFSQLIVPDDGELAEESEAGDDPLYKIGTSSIWTFNSTATHPPAFISPNVENITAVWKLVVDHIKEMHRMAGLVGGTEDIYAQRSGRASQMGFMGVNSTLANKAGKYQKFENEISKLAYMQLGIDPEKYEDVKYPSTFDITALSDELDSHFKILSRRFSETLNKTIMKNIARKAIPLASQSVRKAVEDEIEAGGGEFTDANDFGDNQGELNGDGNPNVQNLKNTFKSNDTKTKEESTHRKEE